MTRNTWFVLLLALPALSHGELLVLVNANIINPAADEPEFRASILIEEGRIVDVTNIDIETLPEGARLIDVSDKYVIPGLIDTHNHLHFGHDDAPWEPGAILDYLPKWGVTAVFDTAIPMEDFERLKAEE